MEFLGSTLVFPDLRTTDGRQRLLLVGCVSVFSNALDRRRYKNLDKKIKAAEITSEEKEQTKMGQVAFWELLHNLGGHGYATATVFSSIQGTPKRTALPVYSMIHFARAVSRFAYQLWTEPEDTRLSHTIDASQLTDNLKQDFVDFAGKDFAKLFEVGITEGPHDNFIFSDYCWVSSRAKADDNFILEEVPVKPLPGGSKTVRFQGTTKHRRLRFDGSNVAETDSENIPKRKGLLQADKCAKKR